MKALFPDGEGGVFQADIPKPELIPDSVLCRMTKSLISPGTEYGIIRRAQGRSKDEVLQMGMTLGYNGVGIVESVDGDALSLSPGQRVAYYGAPWVTHSEYVVVPRHLVLPIPDKVSDDQAVFMGLGAIALHGFRKGRMQIGETCLVAGAGIIGNLCAQFALHAGCRVVLSDYDRDRIHVVRRCVSNDADIVYCTPEGVDSSVEQISEGAGADSIFLCMGTTSDKPMEQAVRLVRPGGRIVILGVLDIRVPRDDFFMREAEITISRAAGPGRYDPNYESKGIDYPIQYSRWTEGRNIAETLRLISNSGLTVSPLISHQYPISQFPDAYKTIFAGEGLGIILDWK